MKVLKLVVISGKGLKNVHIVSKMKPFTVISIAGLLTTHHRSPIKTPTDRGRNPVWSFYSEFELPESDLQQNRLTVVFQIFSKSHLLGGYRDIGKAFVSAKHLFDHIHRVGDGTVMPVITTLPVTTPAGKIQGELTFSYEFGDVTEENGQEVNTHAPSTGDSSLLVSGCIAEFLPRVCGTVVGNFLTDVV